MELFNSVGIELEVEDIRQNELSLSNSIFRIHRDASCESDGYLSNGFKINTDDSAEDLIRQLRLSRNTYGCELVTGGTLNTSTPEYLYQLKKLTNLLISKGESPKSYRAGFHVHINLSYNLRIIKSILRLSRHLEQVLYLLGGMGYDYRGFKNDSTYCRPITKFGPVCVPTGRSNYSQVFTIQELLKSKTTDEFKIKYGNIDKLRNNHYIPIRYHGINLLPLFTQGSLEFRMFNKSTNPFFLMAIIEFCKAFSEYAVHSSFKSLKEENLLRENSVFDVRGEIDRQKIIDTFAHFLELSNLEDEMVIETLFEILTSSSVDSIVLPNEYIYSHLIYHRQGNRCPTHWQNGEYIAKAIPRNTISEPNFEDIHVLRNRNRNLTENNRRLIIENINQIAPRRNERIPIQLIADRIRERYGEILSGPREDFRGRRYFVVRGNTRLNNMRLNIFYNHAGITNVQEVEEPEEPEEILFHINETRGE
jgi:hypothetical protein